MKEKTPKRMTLDSLAAMVQRGFEETAKKTEVDTQFALVHKSLEHIEKVLIAAQDKRIEKLEKKVEEIRDALAMK